MFRQPLTKASSLSTLNRFLARELIVELNQDAQESFSGGAAPPCKDDDDTGCYDLVNLECRVLDTSSQIIRLS